jgi:tryptophan-rich sensory protein
MYKTTPVKHDHNTDGQNNTRETWSQYRWTKQHIWCCFVHLYCDHVSLVLFCPPVLWSCFSGVVLSTCIVMMFLWCCFVHLYCDHVSLVLFCPSVLWSCFSGVVLSICIVIMFHWCCLVHLYCDHVSPLLIFPSAL